MKTQGFVYLLTTALMASFPADVFAAEAGSVIFARGEVTAERQPPVPLAKGDDVLDDDTVATGDAARAQLLLLDGAKIAIRPNSRLRIDEFVYQGAPVTEAGAAVVSTTGDRSVSTLIKGGFRTITGAIGKEEREAYEVRTPVGVLGIRGTEYSAVFCNSDCDWVPGFNPANPIEDGLYLGVTEGSIVFSNEIANLVLQAGEFAFIPLVSRVPAQLQTPPPVLLDDNDLRFNADGQAAAGTVDPATAGFDSRLGTRRAPETSAPDPDSSAPGAGGAVPAQSIIVTDPDGTPVDITPGDSTRPQGNREIGFSTGPIGQVPTEDGVQTNAPDEYRLDSGNNLTGFLGDFPARTGPVGGRYDINTAQNVETGFDTMTVMRWGRWSGGTVTVDTGTGQLDTIDLANQSLHWISGPENGTPNMPISGTASYSLLGATSPTDNFGNVGVLGSATFDADFTNMTVDSTLDLTVNQVNWVASGFGAMGSQADPAVLPHQFNGNYSVIVGGFTGGSGTFSGFFSAPGQTSDPSFPGGVGLTYSLTDPNNTTTVSGAAVFGNP